MDTHKQYELKSYETVEESEVTWLWYPYFPNGKITILQGDPGDGKTSLMLQIAASLSNGKGIPDGTYRIQPQNVIFQETEDGLADTIKPRLTKAGADCSRIFYLDPLDEKALSLGDVRFEKAIRELDAKLLIIDPLQSFLPTDSDMNNASSLRKALQQIAKAAERTGCAVVIIGHMNKGNGTKGIYRGLGSIDIAAVARSVLLVARDQEDRDVRVMVPIKSSLAPEGPAYAFSLTERRGFRWIGETDHTADNLLGMRNGDLKIERAKASLLTLLGEGDLPSTVVFERMSALGISKRTVQSAKKDLKIYAYRKDNKWYWSTNQRR